MGKYVYITSNAGHIYRYIISQESLQLLEDLVAVVGNSIGIGRAYPQHSSRLYLARSVLNYYVVDEFSPRLEHIQRIALYTALSGQVPASVVGIHNRVYVARSDRAVIDVWSRDGKKVEEIVVSDKRKGLDYDARNFFDYHTTSLGSLYDQRLGFSNFAGQERKYFSFGSVMLVGFTPKSAVFDGQRYNWLFKQQSDTEVEPKYPESTEEETEYALSEY